MIIKVLDGYALNPGDLSWDEISKQGEFSLFDRTKNTEECVLEAIGNAEIIFTNKTVLTREILSKAKSVKYIGVLATGYNIVDIEATRELGMVVTNIPSYCSEAVAQFTFALLLELCHNIGNHNNAVQQGDWIQSIDFTFRLYPLIELQHKTIGIIGFGRIGKQVATIAKAFGMNVLVYTRRKIENQDGSIFQVELNELLYKSDVISLHCPLNNETMGMINKKSISMMKDGAIVLNTSRGPLIVEADLANALNDGKLGGAALDVISAEPMEAQNPLRNAKNCIITPHIAWASKESRQRLMSTAAKNLEAFLLGNPINVVNQ